MIMCFLLCYPVSFHMLQLLLTACPISSYETNLSVNILYNCFWKILVLCIVKIKLFSACQIYNMPYHIFS